MKIKNVKLKWNVLIHEFNGDIIKPYNIFWNDFTEELSKRIKRDKIENKEQLKETLRKIFMYHYWSKSEFEILVSGLSSKYDKQYKLDIWYQIEMNFDHIIDYIIREMKLF